MVKWLIWLVIGIVIGAFFGVAIFGWFWDNLLEGIRIIFSSFS